MFMLLKQIPFLDQIFVHLPDEERKQGEVSKEGEKFLLPFFLLSLFDLEQQP